MTTVYLHIGTMKTGTSTLQSFMAKNRELLESYGYSYPQMEVGLPANFIYRNGNFLIRQAYKNVINRMDVETILENGYVQIGELAKRFEHIVLSDELIWHLSERKENFWSDMIDNFHKIGCEVKILVYLRRQDMLAESLYNQRVKINDMESESFEKSFDDGRVSFFCLDYYKHLKKIEKYVKKENMIIRIYEKEQFEGEEAIYSDFLKAVGLEWNESYKKPDGRTANLGLQGNYIELKRNINRLPEYRELGDFMSKPLRAASEIKSESSLHGKESLLTPEKQILFMQQFEEGNRKLAMEFLGRKDGILFHEPIGNRPFWKIDVETLYQDVVMIMASTFCQQERQILEAKQRIEQMEEEIQSVKEELGLRKLILRSLRTVKRKILHK